MNFIYLFGVFISGVNVALNLVALRYPESSPAHYSGEWWEVALALLLAVLFGLSAISKKPSQRTNRNKK